MELIDTDVLIDVQRDFSAAADWFATDPDFGIPGFVVMEGLGLLDALIAATAVGHGGVLNTFNERALPHVPRADDRAAVPAVVWPSVWIVT